MHNNQKWHDILIGANSNICFINDSSMAIQKR